VSDVTKNFTKTSIENYLTPTIRDLHGDEDRGNPMAGIRRNPVGMECNVAVFPRGWKQR